MAYDYNKAKKAYQSLDPQQQQQYVDQNKNDANFQRFYKDYMAEVNGKNTTSTPTNTVTSTYQNQWAGNYTYNPTSQYYEKSTWWYQNQWQGTYTYNPVSWYYENQTKPQTNQYTDYSKYNNNSNFYWQNNQWNSSYNNNANSINQTLYNQTYNLANQWNKGYSDLMWGSNYAQDFDTAVNNKLKQAFWLNSLEEVKERYPEYYDSLVQALDTVKPVFDAADPNSKQMLDAQLQAILWSAIGAWSDTSKLNVLNQSLIDKFENWEQVSEDMRNIVKLQTEWKTTAEIAKEMWISEDQVQQAILAYNWLDNKLWEYYKLKEWVAKDITETYDTKLARLDEEKKIALERANRQVDQLTEDFNTSIDRQKQQNDINAHNADAIAWRTGLWFSKRGIEWMNYVAEQARQIIDDITKNYDRNNQNLADGIADIIRNWQRNNEDLMKASQDALTAAKNNFTSNMLAVQQQYGTVWLQAQQALANNVQWFIEQAQNIYDNALVRQQQNLTNLINNVSNINALEAQNLTMRNAKIQQFQAESMNLNRNQLQQLANQLGMDSASYQDLVNYQVQAVANQLNGYLAWSGVQFQSQIQSLLDQWYTPTQAMSSIMQSADFKAMQQAAKDSDNWAISNGVMYNKQTGEYKQVWSGEWWAMSNWIMYNKDTWEYYDLNWDEYWTIGNNLYNKRTGEIISWNSGNWLHQFTESEVRTWDTIWNDINSIGHILESEDWLRIWTYKSSNGYTYNVYANREDWIKATEALLKRWYYGMTLADAAQKWIWQWKDISAAKKVIQNKWLSLDAQLSDANVRKFIEAMGTWEWTLKKWQTLSDWSNWWRSLGGWQNYYEWWYDPNLEFVFQNMLAENWKLDSTTQKNLLEKWYSLENIWQQYNAYKESKWVTENEYRLPEWFVVSDIWLFNQLTATDKKDIKDTLASYNSMMASTEKLKELVLKYWTEVLPTTARTQMEQYVRDIQLQSKELYNLWVLNWPDLELMEDIIYNPTWWKSRWSSILNLRNKNDVWGIVENWINTVNNQAIEKLKNYWISIDPTKWTGGNWWDSNNWWAGNGWWGTTVGDEAIDTSKRRIK